MPSFIQTMRNLFNDKRADPESKALVINPMPRPSLAQIKASVRPMRQSPYVALALDLIGDTCAAAGYDVFYLDPGGEMLEVPDHPLLSLFANPNPVDTQYDLLRKTFQAVDSFGNAFWWIEGDGVEVVGLWYLPPSRVRIEPSRTERIARYIYEYQGFSHEFMPGEIVHFRRPSLDDDFYGESLLESIENDIATDIHMSLFQLRFFGTDNATPAGMVGAPSSMTHEQFKQFKEEYYEQFGSGKRRTLVYQQGDENEEITYTPMGAKHEEMEFLASREATRKTILERFGISTGMLSEASTEAHARVAERNFLRACYYRHRAVAERINKDIMPFYGDYLFRFEDVRTGDSQQLLQRRQASEGILTVNEQRREFFGVEPIENQEDLNDASSTNDA